MKHIKIGTRKSILALIQTQLVIDQIKLHYPETECEIVKITTSGDLITDKNLYDIGGKALFLKEIERALSEGEIDLAVHSLKDVPGRVPEGLKIAAVLEREDLRDVLVSYKAKSIKDLPMAAVVGTSSVRRKVMLHRLRPDLNIVMFRGNIDSRLKKLMAEEVDATILASAGLHRAKMFNAEYCSIIPTEDMLPAVGQGVIAVEIRENDQNMQELCNKINHQLTWDIIQAERAYIEYLDASCRTPLAINPHYSQDNLKVDFMISDFDGSYMFFHAEEGSLKEARNMGVKAAKIMLEKISGL